MDWLISVIFFFFQAEDGIRDKLVTGVQTCALPICAPAGSGLGLARLGVEERGRGRSVRECPRALDRSVQRRRVRRARAARRRARLHGSLERDTGGPLRFLPHPPGGAVGSAPRGPLP